MYLQCYYTLQTLSNCDTKNFKMSYIMIPFRKNCSFNLVTLLFCSIEFAVCVF